MADISKIKIPNPAYVSGGAQPQFLEYDIKDTVARAAVAAGFTFHIATDAATTPYGVQWDDDGTIITGTLVASENTKGFYLVPSSNTAARDVYDEYVAAVVGGTGTQGDPYIYAWERLGNTEINFNDLASYLKATPTLTKDEVLGSATTFTAADSSVTFTGGSSDTFVKSYPGTSSKLETATITGVNGEETVNVVASNTDYTATNTVFGTDTTASKIVTESKTATNLVLGASTTASKATAGTALSLAKVAGSATNVSYIGNNSTSSILESATYDSASETLTLGSVSVSQGSVTGTNGTETVTPYTFADVTVPVVTSNDEVSIASVKTNTDVTVPVVSSNTEVTTTKITTASKTLAKKAANATTVATGSLKADDTSGATVMTGLGTATTASAVTGIGTGTAAAQTITVGTNDKVDAVTNVTVAIENKTSA